MSDSDELVNVRCSALVFRGDSVLLCRRSEDEDTWVLPGGTPRLGEGTAAAAEREVLEETGHDTARPDGERLRAGAEALAMKVASLLGEERAS